MIKLSDHFLLSEFCHSQRAEANKLVNAPTLEEVTCMIALCKNVLEPLRAKTGPITITSGYRCKELNELVGGAPNSQHMKGQAVDIQCKTSADALRYFNILKDMNIDQLIWEQHGKTQWIHVSYVGIGNRRQIFIVENS